MQHGQILKIVMHKIFMMAGAVLITAPVLAALTDMSIVQPAYGGESSTPRVTKESFPGASKFDPESAYKYSQSAIGKMIGNYKFRGTDGKMISLDQFGGEPLIISMVYSSCFDICPAITMNLASAVDKARAVLPDKKFNILSIGFDTRRDTPTAMKLFARQYDVNGDNWKVASGAPDAVERLAVDTGFIYFTSPRGFDHLMQTTLVDADGKVDTQIYGENFDATLLVEPLKQLYFGGIASVTDIQSFVNRVRLFCTIYDPKADAYKFDYSFFIGMALSAIVLILMGNFVVRNVWRLWFSDQKNETGKALS